MKYYTLTDADVGQAHIWAFDQAWPVSDFLGHIMNCDVGKRVYKRGVVLQVENQEQYEARMATSSTQQFDDNVAWLQFLANWERRAGGPPLTTPDRDKRMMRIAFDWAIQHPNGLSPAEAEEAAEADAETPWCQCDGTNSDRHGCLHRATLHLFRVTSMVHETPIHDDVPTDFCDPCGDKALESGAYCVGGELLEPHHGPGRIKRMHADINEGGQS